MPKNFHILIYRPFQTFEENRKKSTSQCCGNLESFFLALFLKMELSKFITNNE